MKTRDQAVSRMQEIYVRLQQLAGKHRMSKADDQEFERLKDEFGELRNVIERGDKIAEIVGAARGEGNFRLEGEHNAIRPFAGRDDASPLGGFRDSALRQLERSVQGGLSARSAEVAERLVETGDDLSRSWTARYITDSGSAEYRSAFATLLMEGESRAGLMWSPAERAAFERVTRLKSEQRSMSLTDSSGGFLVPFELDPSIAIVNAGSTCPLIDIARTVVSVTDVWHGVSSAGVQASWDAEASEVSDDSPTLAEPEVPCFKGQSFVPFSVELQGDAVSLLSEVGKLMTDGMTQLLNQALTVGSGSGQPTGIVTALAGGSSVVNTGTGGTLAAEDIYALQNALGPRWQANARWMSNLVVANSIRQEETTNGALKFPSMQGNPPTLLGRPTHEASFMDGTIAAGKNLLIYGDFSNFVVTQRVGATVELIPHLFSPNNLRPTGQRGLWMWARYGADSINDSAFRMLHS
jgi:HK97 family phage major capsid protein